MKNKKYQAKKSLYIVGFAFLKLFCFRFVINICYYLRYYLFKNCCILKEEKKKTVDNYFCCLIKPEIGDHF